MIQKTKQNFTLSNNKHQQYLTTLPKIAQKAKDIQILCSSKDFKKNLLHSIKKAKHHIYLTMLYLEKDQAGKEILTTLFKTKENNKALKIIILVDWHRAQRGRIGEFNNNTNAEWYQQITKKNINTNIPIYGVPINIQEILGVLHLKGFIIDNKVIYSGANINNSYLHQKNIYRYDRYHIINNQILANTMIHYINQYILNTQAIQQLNQINQTKKTKIKNSNIRLLRKTLKKSNYSHHNQQTSHEISITPLVGLGKKNSVNQTINHLICSTTNTITICTPYFNLQKTIQKHLINLLQQGKHIEIIIGDKTANDFYVHDNKKFKLINILPYLYETNLRTFLKKLQIYLNNKQLTVRIWKNKNNGYHLKGIWVDEEWQLLTGNNLNPRAWNLDLENAILIHDPHKMLFQKKTHELHHIYTYTTIITHYSELQNIDEYPKIIKKIIKRLKHIYFDKIINQIL